MEFPHYLLNTSQWECELLREAIYLDDFHDKRQNYFNHGRLKKKKINSVNLLNEQGS